MWRVLSLYSGIGGLDLGLERAGMRIVGQVERDPDRLSVLTRHWPHVPKHNEVATAVEWWNGRKRRPNVNVICGGFPCQPFAKNGHHRSIEDDRWGWPAFARAIRYLQPQLIIVENVTALRTKPVAFGLILGDLARMRFDAEWTVLPACAFGAPHTRSRLFMVAYAQRVNGQARMAGSEQWSLPVIDVRPGPWPSGISGAVPANNKPDRMDAGLAQRMVAAGGDAVVPAVAEHLGRQLITLFGNGPR